MVGKRGKLAAFLRGAGSIIQIFPSSQTTDKPVNPADVSERYKKCVDRIRRGVKAMKSQTDEVTLPVSVRPTIRKIEDATRDAIRNDSRIPEDIRAEIAGTVRFVVVRPRRRLVLIRVAGEARRTSKGDGIPAGNAEKSKK